MIKILFEFGGEKILVTIKGKVVTFAHTAFGAKETTIDGLQLSYEGVIKEFPDLKDNPNWKNETIKRFKEKINSFTTEDQIADYLIEDLKKQGYVPKQMEKGGFRPKLLG